MGNHVTNFIQIKKVGLRLIRQHRTGMCENEQVPSGWFATVMDMNLKTSRTKSMRNVFYILHCF